MTANWYIPPEPSSVPATPSYGYIFVYNCLHLIYCVAAGSDDCALLPK